MFVADEQSDHPVDVARWEALARSVLEHEGVSGDAELALLFVDETTIAELNQTFMGQEGPTDVLAFPIDDEEVGVGRSPDGSTSGPDRDPLADVPLLLGDVVVCPAVAARNAPTHAGTYDGKRVVKGLDHLRTTVDGPIGSALFNRRGELVALHAGRRRATIPIDVVKQRFAPPDAQ